MGQMLHEHQQTPSPEALGMNFCCELGKEELVVSQRQTCSKVTNAARAPALTHA